MFLLPLLIIFFLFKESYEAISHFGLTKFFTDPSWYPSEGLVGLKAQMLGSLLVSFFALIISLPSSLAFVYLNELMIPTRLASFFNLCIDTLSGIPSVIFGLWGLVKVVPLLTESKPPGTSLLVGAIILGMMIFPSFVVGFRQSLKTFDQYYKHASVSLGLSPFHYFYKIFIPSNLRALFSVTLLQFGRALGETMAVLMVTGNVSQIPDSLFSPIRTLTSNIALEMAYATGAHRSSLYMSGLFLAIILLVCLIFAFFLKEKHD